MALALGARAARGPARGDRCAIEGVAQLFARDSYLPEVDGAAGHEIQFQHCPIFAAARIYPRMCAAELEFIREQIPDGQVDRTAWRLDGASVCQYQVGTR